MRRRLNPWAVVITAALTFGSLMAFVGPRSFGHQWGRPGFYRDHSYRYDYGDCNRQHADGRTVRPDSVDNQ